MQTQNVTEVEPISPEERAQVLDNFRAKSINVELWCRNHKFQQPLLYMVLHGRRGKTSRATRCLEIVQALIAEGLLDRPMLAE